MARDRKRRKKIATVVPWLGFTLMVISFGLFEFDRARYSSGVVRSVKAIRLEPFATVVLDAGHGGDDSGAKVEGLLEKDLTLDVTKRVERHLAEQGLRAVLTRQEDQSMSLADRATLANREPECIFVSIHFNETGKRPVASGVETYYAARQAEETAMVSWLPFLQRVSFASANVQSQSLAGFIQEALVARTQAINRGVKAEQFYVIANVRHPAVLVEGGFLSNKADVAQLRSDEYREQMAAAISDGIVKYREVLREGSATLAAGPPGG